MKNIAIILAAGSGRRFGGGVPKQFRMLEGRMVIDHSIELFESIAAIDEIAVVISEEYLSLMQEECKMRGWRKVKYFILGGKERYNSSLNAIKTFASCEPLSTNLILHDAARPWLTAEIVEIVVSELKVHEAVAVGIATTDTIWQSVNDCDKPTIAAIPNRNNIWRAQTPQAFRLGILQRAYAQAQHFGFAEATDDCGIVLRYCPESKIFIVEGSETNRKITFAEDL